MVCCTENSGFNAHGHTELERLKKDAVAKDHLLNEKATLVCISTGIAVKR